MSSKTKAPYLRIYQNEIGYKSAIFCLFSHNMTFLLFIPAVGFIKLYFPYASCPATYGAVPNIWL